MANVLDVPYGQLGDMTKKHPTTICVETLEVRDPKGGAPPQTTTYKQASRFVSLTRTTGPGGRRGVDARASVFADKEPSVRARDESFGRWETTAIPRGSSLSDALALVMARNKQDPKEPILRIKIRMSDSSEVNFSRKNPNQAGTLKFTNYYSPSEATDEVFVEKFGGTVRPPNDASRRVPQLPHMKSLDMPSKVELKAMFQRFDFNGNGMLSLAEVDKAVKEHWPHFNNKHVLIRAFNSADENGTGYVGRLEFEFMIRFIINYTKANREFTKVDTSSDKRISFAEFSNAYKDIDPSKSQSDLKTIFKGLDKNGGGYILFEEFCSYFATKNADVQLQLSGSDTNGIRQRREASKTRGGSVQPKGLRVEAIAVPDIKKANELFDRSDINGNGALSLAEIDRTVVQIWPSLNNKPALMRAYKAADKNGTGLISRKEFIFFLKYVVTYNNLWARFKEIDTNGDRRVGSQEFSTAARSLGIATESQARIAFQRMDTNGGGVVLFDEFCNWMTEVKMGITNPTDGCTLSGMDYADTKANQQVAAQYGRRSITPSSQGGISPGASSRHSRAASSVGNGSGAIAGRRASGRSSVASSRNGGGSTFTTPTKEEIKKLFNRTDVNGNGMLSLAELDKAVIEIWPHFNHKPALMRAYKAADKNKTGFVGRSEFELFVRYIPIFTDIWNTFQRIDPNGDRRLSKEEFVGAAASMRLPGSPSESELGHIFDHADGNKGGFLLFDEFCGLMADIKMKA